MKTLSACFESLLDDDDDFYDTEHNKKVIEEWIKDNYITYGKLTISDDFVVSCDRYVYVENENITSLTNGMFKWGKVGGHFWCNDCTKLKSLEGAPKEVDGDFDCSVCMNLKSLEGAPKKVGGGFSCRRCNKLTTLNGAPEKVSGYFYCNKCVNLTSLEGAPKKLGGRFWCSNCPDLIITQQDKKKYKI